MKHILVYDSGVLLDEDAVRCPDVMDKVEQIIRDHYGEEGVRQMYDPSPTDPILKLGVRIEFEWVEPDGPVRSSPSV